MFSNIHKLIKESLSEIDNLDLNTEASLKSVNKISEYIKLCLFLYKAETNFEISVQIQEVWSYFFTLSKRLPNFPPAFENFLQLIQLIQQNFDKKFTMELDSNFIIQNRLPGHKFFLKTRLLNEEFFSENCLITLNSVKDLLINDYMNVYLVFLKIIDAPKSIKKQKIVEFYWSLFDALLFDEKLDLVNLIVTNLRFKLEKEESLSCLIDQKTFYYKLAVTINKLSSNDSENSEVLYCLKISFQNTTF